MLVTVNAAGLLVLLSVQGLLILSGKVSVVLGAHAALFLVNAGFLVLKMAGFAGGELAAFHTVGDTVLLVDFTLTDGLGRPGLREWERQWSGRIEPGKIRRRGRRERGLHASWGGSWAAVACVDATAYGRSRHRGFGGVARKKKVYFR